MIDVLPKALKYIRETRGGPQKEIAPLVRLSASELAQLELGKKPIPNNFVFLFAKALKIPVSSIFRVCEEIKGDFDKGGRMHNLLANKQLVEDVESYYKRKENK
jgi:transcriptional regulator with XRE-family HTH domain